MTNVEKMNELTERQAHYETMVFSLFDAQLLEDMEQHREALSKDERENWDNQEFYKRVVGR